MKPQCPPRRLASKAATEPRAARPAKSWNGTTGSSWAVITASGEAEAISISGVSV